MRQPLGQHLVQRHHLWHAAKRQHVHVQRNTAFQIRQAEKRFHQQRRVHRAVFRHQNDTNVFSGLVAHVFQKRQPAGQQQFGDFFDQPRLLHLERNFGNDDLVTATAEIFRFPFGTDAETATTGLVGLENILAAFDDDAACRQIGTGNEFQKLLDARIRMLDQMKSRVADFMGIVRRDGCRHADCNAGGAIGQQVWKRAGHDHRLFVFLVVGGAKIDCVLLDAFQKQSRDIGHTRFGVTHGSCAIAVDVAKVTLAIDQRVANGKILRKSHERIVDRRIAMRVEFTHDIADDTGAFLERGIGTNTHLAHGMHDASMNGLQSVTNIRKRAVHDGR